MKQASNYSLVCRVNRIKNILSHDQFAPHVSLSEAQAKIEVINATHSKFVAFSRSNKEVIENLEKVLGYSSK